MDASLRADLVARLAGAGDPDRAEGQQRYMKSELPFHGVRVPEVRRLAGAVIRDHPLTDPDAWEGTVLGIWRAATHREQRYGAIELAYARPYRGWLRPDRLAMVEEMVVTGAWWDYVDQLAGKHMGHLLATYPGDVRPVLLSWAEDDDIWRRRTAILAQLRFKDRTDPGLLFAVIEPSIARKEFFLRKAIGWALREYSKTRPEAVTRYVEANRGRLSPLSRREAMKALASRRRTSEGSPSH
ncbi:MAG: DNA alkylation repair protein [Acidimicrobiia bacterium]|nr:DNA alkylation repair protein [Acidimicrobiia bacterium]